MSLNDPIWLFLIGFFFPFGSKFYRFYLWSIFQCYEFCYPLTQTWYHVQSLQQIYERCICVSYQRENESVSELFQLVSGKLPIWSEVWLRPQQTQSFLRNCLEMTKCLTCLEVITIFFPKKLKRYVPLCKWPRHP